MRPIPRPAMATPATRDFCLQGFEFTRLFSPWEGYQAEIDIVVNGSQSVRQYSPLTCMEGSTFGNTLLS